MSADLLQADALHIPLRDGSVQCVVTSPPYWGLRDYGVGGQLGLEPTPEEYIANMVAVFREVRRVMRDDGTLWLNLGDSYASNGPRANNNGEGASTMGWPGQAHETLNKATGMSLPPLTHGLKPKDLCGIPWRVALALQADGWWLRSDIIWAKPNPMPESVTDRPTKAHEYLFLMTKRARYFYDADAVREELSPTTLAWGTGKRGWGPSNPQHGTPDGVHGPSIRGEGRCGENPAGRNRRTVWTIATQPYSGAHFATFPPALVEPCIKAGTPERGSCPVCGAPWERVVERGDLVATSIRGNYKYNPIKHDDTGLVMASARNDGGHRPGMAYESTTTGHRPTCDHDADPVPAIVLDPFAGSGTTLMVARQLGRRGVGLDLSLDYLREQARPRLALDALDAWQDGDGITAEDDYAALPLFGGTNGKA